MALNFQHQAKRRKQIYINRKLRKQNIRNIWSNVSVFSVSTLYLYYSFHSFQKIFRFLKKYAEIYLHSSVLEVGCFFASHDPKNPKHIQWCWGLDPGVISVLFWKSVTPSGNFCWEDSAVTLHESCVDKTFVCSFYNKVWYFFIEEASYKGLKKDITTSTCAYSLFYWRGFQERTLLLYHSQGQKWHFT